MSNSNEVLAPKKRSDCISGERPCVWIRCKYHMIWWFYYEGSPGGRNVFNMTDDKIVDFIFSMPDTCVLDIADRHEWDGCTLAEVADYVGVTRERIRQILDGVTKNNRREKDGALQLFRKRFKRMYPKAAKEIWSILEDINIRMELADGYRPSI